MDVVHEARLPGGVMRRTRLARAATNRARAAGRLVAPRRGLVALPDLPVDRMLALGLGGVLSCASAAAAVGLDLLDEPAVVHMTVPRGTPIPRDSALVVHRRDVATAQGSTTLARTAADGAVPDARSGTPGDRVGTAQGRQLGRNRAAHVVAGLC